MEDKMEINQYNLMDDLRKYDNQDEIESRMQIE